MSLLDIYSATVLPDWLDYNGHMNEGYYGLAFGFAIDTMFIDWQLPEYMQETGCTFYSAETHITYLQELAVEFGYAKTLADQGLALFRQYRNKVDPYPASEPTLSLLTKHFKVGAITNGNAQLNKTSLGCYFDFVVTAADAGASKPDPRLFTRAAEIANVTMSQIVHVGDCAKSDVVGANNAGCLSIWLNMNRQAWPGGQSPHAVIHCLSELPDLLIEYTN